MGQRQKFSKLEGHAAYYKSTHSAQFISEMKVNLAFTLFSDEVLKGMFLLTADKEQASRSKFTPTAEFVKRMSRLISVMTSRCPTG